MRIMNDARGTKDDRMLRVMIAATASNSGKTAVTCGLAALLKKRGIDTCAFKCGPDYIDPMFHRSVLGIESHNLDVFLAGQKRTKEIFDTYSSGKQAVICEGVMGYYDGIAGSSPWHLASLLDIPSILVIRPGGAALSIAAAVKGFAEFREPSNIAGVILNDCSKGFFDRYGKMLEDESGVPVLGYLPHMEEAVFESRHLGLMTAGEITDIRERIDRIARAMEESIDIARLMEIALQEPDPKDTEISTKKEETPRLRGNVRIAVARDEAFCFIYEESLDQMVRSGGEIVFFSPMSDERLPDKIGGLYLPGGYPELYGRALSSNLSMMESIREAVKEGIPTIAECGGFLYLGESLEDNEGNIWKMTGALPGRSHNTGHLVRFGYGHISQDKDSMLLRKGEKIPVHEFHYWDTSDNGSHMEITKASTGHREKFGYATETLYAGFPHLYMAGEFDIAGRFVSAAREYLKDR